jgi:hypothetical protein
MSVSLKAEPNVDDAQATTPRIEELPAGLDWAGFSARCFAARGFPPRRRHDFAATAAYFTYKQLSAKAAERRRSGEAVAAWEGEGGSTSESPDEPR